jgi:stage III sporulation protein AH
MKKLMHNNQVIITALAIMIAIAGYLNFAGKGVGEVDKSQYYQASSKKIVDDFYNVVDSDEKEVKNSAKEEKKETEQHSDNQENTDNSTEKMVETSGSINTQIEETGNIENTENIGEAVIVNSTISKNYFEQAKLDREQERAKSKEELSRMAADMSLSDEKKEEALNKIVELTANSERENASEMMLEAKGYNNCVVCIVDGKVDVVVDATSITEEEVAQIVDIVKRKTGVESRDIIVTPVNSKKK